MSSAPTADLTRSELPLRVLVVDDEVNIAELISMALRYEGWQVQMAHTGSSAVNTALEQGPDAVVLDMMLPDIDGLEVLRRMDHAARRAGRLPHRPRRGRGPDRGADRRRGRLRHQAVLARGAGGPAARAHAPLRRAARRDDLGARGRRPRARRGQPRGHPRGRADQPDRDRVRAAAVPDAQPEAGPEQGPDPGPRAATTTSAGRPTSSSSTSPTCARRSTSAGRP